MVMMTPAAVARPQASRNFGSAGIAIIDVVAVAAVARHGGRVEIRSDVADAVFLEQRAHDFADPAIADDDGMALSRRPGAR